MQDEGEIEIPEVVPVMTLKETVLFPHAIMPLFIFEKRYRLMLQDIIRGNRLFAVFNESSLERDEDFDEPPALIGTVGVVRAAHENPDGTSNLALQGLMRVRLLQITREDPYRLIRIEACPEDQDCPATVHARQRKKILNLLSTQPEFTKGLPEEYVDFLYSLNQPAPFIDVAIHSLCHSPRIKQRLLETLSLRTRFEAFTDFLLKEQDKLLLFKHLQGETRNDEISKN